MATFEKRTTIAADALEAFAWHARPGAFERLTPPFENVTVEEGGGGIDPGSRVVLRTRVGPIVSRWVAEHRELVPGRSFRDVQVRGPFERWDHDHLFEARDGNSFVMHDRVQYELPLGRIGRMAGGEFVRRKLERVFAYRHATLRDDLAMHKRFGDRPRIRVLIAGSNGLIGRVTSAMLSTGGHEVARLVRPERRLGRGEIGWDPGSGQIDRDAIESFGPDAIVNLAGEPIAVRWNAERKRRIRESRIKATEVLAKTIAELRGKRPALISASGVSYYGDSGDRVLDESAPAAKSFLGSLAREWEEATGPAAEAGARVVTLRIGLVLSPNGGALAAMLPFFRWGLGAALGSGRQHVSWISIDDCAGAIVHSVLDDGLIGAANVTAPNPVTNAEFARTLARSLGRPMLGVCPGWLARVLWGELASEGPLSGQHAMPARLSERGYVFRHPRLESALAHVLGA